MAMLESYNYAKKECIKNAQIQVSTNSLTTLMLFEPYNANFKSIEIKTKSSSRPFLLPFLILISHKCKQYFIHHTEYLKNLTLEL